MSFARNCFWQTNPRMIFPIGNKIAAIFTNEYAGIERVKEADQVAVDCGISPLDDLYFALKDGSVRHGEGMPVG